MKALIIALVLIVAQQAYAGNDGHGGGGFLIKDKVYLLDLVEAKNSRINGGFTENGLNIVESNEPVEIQVEKALSRLDMWIQLDHSWVPFYVPELNNLAKNVRKSYKQLQSIKKFIGKESRLLFPDDANLRFKPDGSTPVGIALWDESVAGEILWIDQEYYNHMSNTHKAALLIHESVYKALRSKPYYQNNSVKTRQIIGYLFSDLKPVHISKSLGTVSYSGAIFLNRRSMDTVKLKLEIVKYPDNYEQLSNKQKIRACHSSATLYSNIDKEKYAKNSEKNPNNLDLEVSANEKISEREFHPVDFVNRYSLTGSIDVFQIYFWSSNQYIESNHCDYKLSLTQNDGTIIKSYWSRDSQVEFMFQGIIDVTDNPYALNIPLHLK